MVRKLKTWHICIPGFRQHEGEVTGMRRLWLALGTLRSRTCDVVLREWNSHWAGIADLIVQCSESNPTIRVYAYSWGAGHGFVTLARELRVRGLEIQTAVLCDPVYRGRTILGACLAYVPMVPLTVPDNVREVWYTRQYVSCLRGHRVRAEDHHVTVVHSPLILKAGHTWMDDHPAFFDMCLTVAGIGKEAAA